MAYLFDTGIFAANDSSGASLSGAKLTFYDNGTTTLKNTYPTKADAEAGTNANANPVVADANGRWGAIWLDDTFYTVKFQPADGSFTRTRDDIGVALADLASTASGKGAELVAGAMRVVRPEDYGAIGDGITDDTTAIQTAITASASKGVPLYFSASYVLDRITITENQDWVFAVGAYLLREPSAIAGNWITVTADIFEAQGAVFDGNTANTNACHNLVISTGCVSSMLEDCESRNAVYSGGYGSGVVYNLVVADEQIHTVRNLNAHDNGAFGLQGLSGKHITLEGGNYYNNGQGGVTLNNYDQTFTQKLYNVILDAPRIFNNTGTGLTIANHIDDNITTASPKDYGHANIEDDTIIVDGALIYSNTNYGAALSGQKVVLSNSVIRNNGDGGTTFGGVLANGLDMTIDGNIIIGNLAYGIDAGNLQRGKITNNIIEFNGITTSTPGLNVEACLQVDVTNNRISGNNASTGADLLCNRHGGDGAGAWFPDEQTKILIARNTFEVTESRYGVSIIDGADNIAIVNNHFQGSDPSKYVLCIGDLVTISGNTCEGGISRLITPDGSGVLYVPEIFEDIAVNSATTIEGIRYSSQSSVPDTKVGWVDVTAGGSGYTSAPTVTFSGGGGSGAAGFAIVKDGVVIGVRMTNRGSGYTSTPTVGFTGGGGSGATATAQRGVPIQNYRTLRIHAYQASTYKRAGTVGPALESPSGADLSVPAHGVITLRSEAHQWYLAGKNY